MIFFHTGSPGDIIYSLPFVISAGGGTYCVYKKQEYNFLKDLLLSQQYISDVICGGYKIEYVNLTLYRFVETDLTVWRHIEHLATVYYRIADRKIPSFDLTQPWIIDITPKRINKIVINRTRRYKNKDLYQRKFKWEVLADYKKDCVFLGHEEERRRFAIATGLDIEGYQCKDALEMTQVIAGADLFIGNQSLAFALAEAIKQTRVLEICWRHPNCIPATENSYIELTDAVIKECVK